jgi:hypothetical protein
MHSLLPCLLQQDHHQLTTQQVLSFGGVAVSLSGLRL